MKKGILIFAVFILFFGCEDEEFLGGKTYKSSYKDTLGLHSFSDTVNVSLIQSSADANNYNEKKVILEDKQEDSDFFEMILYVDYSGSEKEPSPNIEIFEKMDSVLVYYSDFDLVEKRISKVGLITGIETTPKPTSFFIDSLKIIKSADKTINFNYIVR